RPARASPRRFWPPSASSPTSWATAAKSFTSRRATCAGGHTGPEAEAFRPCVSSSLTTTATPWTCWSPTFASRATTSWARRPPAGAGQRSRRVRSDPASSDDALGPLGLLHLLSGPLLLQALPLLLVLPRGGRLVRHSWTLRPPGPVLSFLVTKLPLQGPQRQ